MEDFTFDIDGLLSDDEANKLFSEDQGQDQEPEVQDEGLEENPEEENAEVQEEPEKVGNKENDKEKEDVEPEDGGSSPNVFYSSIASALKDDGIFPDLDDKAIKGIKGPEDFGELFEQAVQARLDEKQKRIDDALNYGVKPDTVRSYEQTIQYLDSINEEALSAEGDDADNLRRQILYNDLINRGFSQDRANREIKKSFDAGTEIEDAVDALDALKEFYKKGYAEVRESAKKQHDSLIQAQKKNAEDFRKMVLDEDVVLGDQALDKNTRQKIYDAVSKPVWKDPDTGKLLTQVQKFQKEKPLEFLKQLGLWFVLTNEGKDLVGFTKGAVKKEKHKAMRDLENKINATSMNPDGSLRFASGEKDYDESSDPLLSDGWTVGYGKN